MNCKDIAGIDQISKFVILSVAEESRIVY